jgi:hypothetical protein
MTTTMQIATTPNQWLTYQEARKRAGLTKGQLINVMRKNPLTVQQFPGCRPRVLARDVDKLIASAIRPVPGSTLDDDGPGAA